MDNVKVRLTEYETLDEYTDVVQSFNNVHSLLCIVKKKLFYNNNQILHIVINIVDDETQKSISYNILTSSAESLALCQYFRDRAEKIEFSKIIVLLLKDINHVEKDEKYLIYH